MLFSVLTEFLVFRYSLLYLKLTCSQFQRESWVKLSVSSHSFVTPTAKDDHAFANIIKKCKLLEYSSEVIVFFSNLLFKSERFKYDIYSYSSHGLKEIVTS